MALADSVAEQGPLDILINNAAQTVRRTPGAYAPLAEAESAPLPEGPLPELLTFGHTSDAHPAALVGSVVGAPGRWPATAHTAEELTSAGADRPARPTSSGSTPAGSCPTRSTSTAGPSASTRSTRSSCSRCSCATPTAPFILVSRLRPSMAAAAARRTYVVNVSAMEGQFSRRYKGPGHPHTNMAKAALNMLTRTSAGEMLEQDGILMTAVDTGWITDERPHPTKVRLAEEGFKAPLDLVDGAARVYDPIVRGEAGEDVHGVFLKDYVASPW